MVEVSAFQHAGIAGFVSLTALLQLIDTTCSCDLGFHLFNCSPNGECTAKIIAAAGLNPDTAQNASLFLSQN
jgi:hypothetical protein